MWPSLPQQRTFYTQPPRLSSCNGEQGTDILLEDLGIHIVKLPANYSYPFSLETHTSINKTVKEFLYQVLHNIYVLGYFNAFIWLLHVKHNGEQLRLVRLRSQVGMMNCQLPPLLFLPHELFIWSMYGFLMCKGLISGSQSK